MLYLIISSNPLEILNVVLSTGFGRNFLFEKQIRPKVIKMSGGLYPAPLKIIDVIISNSFSVMQNHPFSLLLTDLQFRHFHFFVLRIRQTISRLLCYTSHLYILQTISVFSNVMLSSKQYKCYHF